MSYQMIPASGIDRLKWDSCVHYATQPAFSGYTWYLNAISKDWVGLVFKDYETVLPLFFQKDWLGRRHYRQPLRFAPAGPFSTQVINRPRILELLRALPARTADLLLVWEGQVGLEHIIDVPLQRGLLKLYEPYEHLAAGFDPLIESNDPDLLYGSPTPEELTRFWEAHSPSYPEKKEDLHRYHRIMYQVMHRGLGFSTSVHHEEGPPLAAAYFISSHGYLFRLMSAHVPGPSGVQAMRELYRSTILTHAGRPVILDFNGDPMAAEFGATHLSYTNVSNIAG
jgi:hypothetical protein